jgi:hypothetical protein
MSLESRSRCEAPDTPLIDAVIGGYVTWREENAAVAATSETWTCSPTHVRAIAFAEDVAALDREERAASDYHRLLKQAAAA